MATRSDNHVCKYFDNWQCIECGEFDAEASSMGSCVDDAETSSDAETLSEDTPLVQFLGSILLSFLRGK